MLRRFHTLFVKGELKIQQEIEIKVVERRTQPLFGFSFTGLAAFSLPLSEIFPAFSPLFNFPTDRIARINSRL
jgi:hypothetical protein